MNNEPNVAPVAEKKGMFSELMPLAAERILLITISRVDEQTLCVNFVPKQLKSSENDALTTPLCLRGTPAELDQHLVERVRSYVASHAALASDLAQVQKEMDEAAKKAREEARSKNRKVSDKNKTGKDAESSLADSRKDAQPTAPAPPTPMSLFEQAGVVQANASNDNKPGEEGCGLPR
ncbi:MAG: PRTRC system protein E [Bryobacteraceae bacterium]|nr:PRTRC system protein E [Bryobacteraceae bacterium]